MTFTVRKNTVDCVLLALVGILFIGAAFAIYGPFQDSLLYWIIMEESRGKDFLQIIQDDAARIGKYEPLLPLILWLGSSIVNSASVFVLVYYTLVSSAALYAGYKLNPRIAPVHLLLIAGSYWPVSVNLYFWKAGIAYAILFVGIAVGLRKPTAWVLIGLSILCHYSTVAFLLLYACILAARSLRISAPLIICVISMSAVASIPLIPYAALSFASQGDATPYLAGNFNAHSFARFASYILLGLLLYFNRPTRLSAVPQTMLGQKYQTLWILCVALLLAGIGTVFTHYLFSLRLTLPVLLFGPFLCFRGKPGNLGMNTAILAVSAIPTVWLAIRMISGSFRPQ